MNNSPLNVEQADAFARASPSFGALFEADQPQSTSCTAFDGRIDDPPPPYHSSSRSPSLTPTGEPFEATDNDPIFLQKLAENARAIPLLWEQNKYQGWSTKQIQWDIEAWKELGEQVEQDKAERNERLFKLLTSGPSFGLFEDGGSKVEHERKIQSHTSKVGMQRCKRRRTEVELLCDGIQGVFDSSPEPSKHARRNEARQNRNMLSNNRTWRRTKSGEPSTVVHPAL